MRSDDIVEIVPHLYISNWDTSNNPIELEKNHIKAVLSLETTPKPYEILNYYKTRKISHMYIHIGDLPSENIRKYFDRTYSFIDYYIYRGQNVLVPGMAGISRSATIIINYIIRKSYENHKVKTCPCKFVKKIIAYARSIRPIINPNDGFQSQLLTNAIIYQNDMARYGKI